MGISRTSNRWLNRFYKIIAILLVTIAVLISSLRLLLPYAHNYRLDFQHYINNTYQSNVTIGSLHMDWHGAGPSLVAKNVSFIQAKDVEVFVGTINFDLDFWRSITRLELVTKALTLDAIKILVDQSLINVTSTEKSSEAPLVDNIIDLFLQRIDRFSLTNSQVIYRTQKSERTFLVNELNWLNQGEHHRAEGQVLVDGLTSNNLNLSLMVTGTKLSEMKGLLYVEANQLNITPWLDKVLAIKDEDTHSSINFDAWLTIGQGAINKIQVALGENQIAWQHLASIQTFNIKQGQLLFSNITNSEEFSVSTSPLIFSSNNREWQPLSFELNVEAGQLNGYLSELDMSGVAQLAPLLTDNKQARKILYGLNPSGNISDIFWQTRAGELSANAQFSALAVNYYEGIPSINGLAGEATFHNNQLAINVQSHEGEVDFNKHFPRVMPYKNLAATVSVFFQENGVLTHVDNIALLSEELNLAGSVAIDARGDSPVKMALLADVTQVNAEHVPNYYPHLLMGQSLVDYLTESLVNGHVEQAKVLFNGPLTDFPFTQRQGVFTVDAELQQSTFKFDQQWPAIKNFSGNLNFTNNSMLITGRSGSLEGVDVTGVTARIDELVGSQLLQIDAEFNETNASDVTRLMQKSPLTNSVGAVLTQVEVSDNISGHFGLTIPLQNTDNTVATGAVNFNNNSVALQAPTMNFTQVNGQLSFENDVIKTNDIELMWRGMPLVLNVNAQSTPTHYQTNFNINANWQQKAWRAQLPPLLTQYAEGVLAWQGDLTLENSEDGQFSYELLVNSDLAGTKLSLPAPFTKAPKENRTVSVNVQGDSKQSSIDAVVSNQMNFYGVLDHEQVMFTRAHLILGQEDVLLPLTGFHITANLAEANLLQWQPLVVDIIDSVNNFANSGADKAGGSNAQPLLAKPQKISGKVKQFNVLDEVIDDVSFSMHDEQAWWILELNSVQARAELKFFPDWYQQGISIEADFINILNKTDTATKEGAELAIASGTSIEDIELEYATTDKIFSNIPPINFSCLQCQYKGLNLGKVNFVVKRDDDNTLSMSNFVAKRKKNNINFDLKWQRQEQQHLTSIKGELSVDDLEQEFKQLGFASLIKDSGVDGSYNVSWQGSPYQWNLATLNGDVATKFDDGYLADVDDKGLRIFSLLSLQSLVRKLTLDFRDIFSDGMFYSEIKAKAHIKDGVLYTDNAKMKGPAGDLSIKGNTDLITSSLDYRMTYKPNFSASLPAIAWIATLNPVTFLGALALDEVLISKVWSELNFEVTGNINEPNLQEVNRKSQNISVGRSSPPQIVESDIKEESTNKVPPVDELNKANKSDG
ncbi:MAG: YhdP family protein [Thalassotalea sp.]